MSNKSLILMGHFCQHKKQKLILQFEFFVLPLHVP